MPEIDPEIARLSQLESKGIELTANEKERLRAARKSSEQPAARRPNPGRLAIGAGVIALIGIVGYWGPAFLDDRAWEEAEASGNFEAYLSERPEGKHATAARDRRDWANTEGCETHLAIAEAAIRYEQYLRDHPDGVGVRVARSRLDQLGTRFDVVCVADSHVVRRLWRKSLTPTTAEHNSVLIIRSKPSGPTPLISSATPPPPSDWPQVFGLETGCAFLARPGEEIVLLKRIDLTKGDEELALEFGCDQPTRLKGRRIARWVYEYASRSLVEGEVAFSMNPTGGMDQADPERANRLRDFEEVRILMEPNRDDQGAEIIRSLGLRVGHAYLTNGSNGEAIWAELLGTVDVSVPRDQIRTALEAGTN